MPAIVITAANSITDGLTLTNPALGNPITIEDGGSITDAADEAMSLNGGIYKLIINGRVSTSESTSSGLRLEGDGKGTSQITIGATGEVLGANSTNTNSFGILSFHATTINNAGYIGGNNGIRVQSGKTAISLNNSNYIESTLNLTDSPDLFFSHSVLLSSIGKKTVVNSGTLDGGLFVNSGTSSITNAIGGVIQGHALVGDNNNVAVDAFSSKDKVNNAGTITGHVNLGAFNDSLSNSGSISGNVSLGDGKDKLSNTGSIGGKVDLGLGDDTFTGGNSQDFVFDAGGKDSYKLGGGSDRFFAFGSASGGSGDGKIDTVDGGAESDLYSIEGAALGAHVINIDNVKQTDFLTGTVAAKNTAIGAAVGKDIIKNFEEVRGSEGNDLIFGSKAANFLEGFGGDDTIYGGDGDDRIFGDNGADKLIGGAGADRLSGDARDNSVDTFYYTKLTDSTVAVEGRDIISDFGDSSVLGEDVIEFRGFGLSFVSFIGEAAFTVAPGVAQLRVVTNFVNSSSLLLDADGNGVADMQIDFAFSTVNWDVSDFVFS
jgi:hypothetical protein